MAIVGSWIKREKNAPVKGVGYRKGVSSFKEPHLFPADLKLNLQYNL